jgi:hypothetical protein
LVLILFFNSCLKREIKITLLNARRKSFVVIYKRAGLTRPGVQKNAGLRQPALIQKNQTYFLYSVLFAFIGNDPN